MKKVTIYTTKFCGFCHQAKRILASHKIAFEEIPLDGQFAKRQELSEQLGGYNTVPMIFIDGAFIGGCSELMQMERDGKL